MQHSTCATNHTKFTVTEQRNTDLRKITRRVIRHLAVELGVHGQREVLIHLFLHPPDHRRSPRSTSSRQLLDLVIGWKLHVFRAVLQLLVNRSKQNVLETLQEFWRQCLHAILVDGPYGSESKEEIKALEEALLDNLRSLIGQCVKMHICNTLSKALPSAHPSPTT